MLTLLCLNLHLYVLTLAMNRKITTKKRIFLLKYWWKTNTDEVIQLFVERFPQTPAQSRQGFYKLNKQFEATGRVNNLPKSERPRTATGEAKITTVVESFVQSPNKSLRKRSTEFDISYTNVL